MSSIKEVERYMRSQGFVVLRQGKHTVWTDGKVQVLTSCSPRTDNELNYARQRIQRARREADEHREVVPCQP